MTRPSGTHSRTHTSARVAGATGRRLAIAAATAALTLACARGGAVEARVDPQIASHALAPCPASPNCVSSLAAEPAHRVEPFELALPAPVAWAAARQAVAALARTKIVEVGADYLHAEVRSALFGFVDDLELRLRAADGVIEVRSASRTGYSDLGVNRRRVRALRTTLTENGTLHP